MTSVVLDIEFLTKSGCNDLWQLVAFDSEGHLSHKTVENSQYVFHVVFIESKSWLEMAADVYILWKVRMASLDEVLALWDALEVIRVALSMNESSTLDKIGEGVIVASEFQLNPVGHWQNQVFEFGKT